MIKLFLFNFIKFMEWIQIILIWGCFRGNFTRKRENRAVLDCLGSNTWRTSKLSSHVFLSSSTLLFIPTLSLPPAIITVCLELQARKKCLWLWVSASQHRLSRNSDGVPFPISNAILHHFPSLVLLHLCLPLP